MSASFTTQPEFWTLVQWENALGEWYDVDGWQGTFIEGDKVVWWVGSDRLGEGPFRWLVYESQGGGLLTMSDPFDLPAAAGGRVLVEVSLEP